MEENLLRVGVISSVHGIKGEVKVYPTTDDIGRFRQLTEVYVDTGKGLRLLTVEGVRFFKNQAIVKMKEFRSVEDAQTYKGKNLLVTREQAVPLKEGEYFICDLLGSTVLLEDGTVLGELAEVLKTAANDVYVIRAEGRKEILIPATNECVGEISVEQKTIVVHPLPGLLEE